MAMETLQTKDDLEKMLARLRRRDRGSLQAQRHVSGQRPCTGANCPAQARDACLLRGGAVRKGRVRSRS